MSLVNLRRATWISKCSFNSSTLERIVLPHILYCLAEIHKAFVLPHRHKKTKHDSSCLSFWHWLVAHFIPTMHLSFLPCYIYFLKWGLDCSSYVGWLIWTAGGMQQLIGSWYWDTVHCCPPPPTTHQAKPQWPLYSREGRGFAGCSRFLCRRWSCCSRHACRHACRLHSPRRSQSCSRHACLLDVVTDTSPDRLWGLKQISLGNPHFDHSL